MHTTPQSAFLHSKAELSAFIAAEHFAKNRSIRDLERELGLANGLVSKWCIRHGITTRSQAEGASIAVKRPETVAKRSGKNHWAWGLKLPDVARRMVERNPMNMPGCRERASAAVADTWREKLTPSETFLAGILGSRVTPQFCFGKYVMDLAFVAERIDLEIDGKNHGFGSRNSNDKIRDAWLAENGWHVVRVSREPAMRPRHLINVLKDLIPDLQLATELPLESAGNRSYKYRVLVRGPKDPAGRKV